MRRIILLLLLFAVGPTARASEVAESYLDQEADRVFRAPPLSREGTRNYVDFDGGEDSAPSRRTRTRAPRRSRRAHYRRHATSSKYVNACSQFIDFDGHVGKLGTMIEQEIMASRYKKQFLRGSGIQDYCPRYASFTSDRQRLRAWVAFWAVLASQETACGTDSATYQRGKKEYGVWQLERYWAKRSTRGPECAELNSVRSEAACSISIMGDTQFRKGLKVYSNGSYWGPVIRSQSQIFPDMSRFDFCN